jgi:hypothetical protein
MKSVIVLICIAMICGFGSSAAIGRASNASIAVGTATGVGSDQPQAQKRSSNKQAARHAPSNLAGLKGTVVSEMRATKAFVKENVVKQGNADRGLMLLAGIGLIALQLRRKHKSRPQRPIAPYA